MNWKKWAYATAILGGLYYSVLQGTSATSSSTSHTIKWGFSLKNQLVTGKFPFSCPSAVIDSSPLPYANTQVEPSLAVGRNPIHPRYPMVVIGYQEGRYRAAGGASDDFMIISLDGGKTFGKPIPAPVVSCFGGSFERASDPHVAITNNGEIYFTTNPLSVSNGDLTSVSISKYNMQKENFIYTQYLDAADKLKPPFTSTDYEGIFIDPQDPDGKLAYMTWDFLTFPNGGSISTSLFKFSKTTDGIHWAKPITVDPFPPSALAKFGNDVGPQFLAFDFLNNPGKPFSKILATFALTVNPDYSVPPYTQASFTYSMVSEDQGKTWTNPIPVNNTLSDVLGQVVDPDNTDIPIRSAVSGTTVDRERNIIYLVTQEHSLVYDGIPTQVVLYYSLDDAASWNLVGPINTVLSTQAFNPASCLINEGRIAVSYYDFRNYTGKNPDAPLLTDRWMNIYYFNKETRTLTLEAEIRLTDTSFNFRFAPRLVGSPVVPSGLFLGDYMGQAYFEHQIFNVYPIVPQDAGPDSAHLQLSILTQEKPIPGNQ